MAISYADSVVPSGVQNGVNQTFGLPSAPSPAASLKYYYNGILQQQGVDYTLSGQSVIFTVTKPVVGDVQVAWYRD